MDAIKSTVHKVTYSFVNSSTEGTQNYNIKIYHAHLNMNNRVYGSSFFKMFTINHLLTCFFIQ